MKVDFYNTRPTPSKRFGLVPSRASANKGSHRNSLPEDRVYDTATEISRRPGNDNRRCIAHFSLPYLDKCSHTDVSSPYSAVRRTGLPPKRRTRCEYEDSPRHLLSERDQ